jgi:CheY-like chemotaxis protein
MSSVALEAAMDRIRLIHWNAGEAEVRATFLVGAGFTVDYAPLTPAELRALREKPPSAIVLDLSRAPSQGRDLALVLRKHRSTRHVPLVFVDGEPEKVDRIRELLPDATYATWDRIESALLHAIRNPVADPVVHESAFAAYAGTPLPKKLGIKADSVVTVIAGPVSFEETLGELPSGVVVRRANPDPHGVTLWFVRSRQELEDQIEEMGAYAAGGGLWIAWPKKASGVVSDLSQQVVREVGLASGLVDFKICSIDDTWSGLRFSQRA